jgi:hypothetical protein
MSDAIVNQIKDDDTPIEELAERSIVFSRGTAPNGSTQLTAPASDWYATILLADRQGRPRIRTSLAMMLTKHYPGLVDPSDSDMVLSLLVTAENLQKIVDVASAGTGIEFVDAEYDGDIAANPARVSVAREAKASTPKECECGCGGMTRGGKFIPGHDSKMKSRLLQELSNPETRQAAADTMIERGWATQEQIDQKLENADRKVAAAAEKAQERERKAQEKEDARVARIAERQAAAESAAATAAA